MNRLRRKLLERLALNSFIRGDFAKAEAHFLVLKRAEPDRMGVDHNLGLARLGLKRYGEAERCFRREIELYGDSYLRTKTLGDLYYIWGKRTESAERYRAALDTCEDARESALLKARLRLLSSEDSFTQVLKAHETFERAVELQRAGDLEGAKGELRSAVTLDPTNFQAWNNLGSVLTELDANYTEALACFTKAASYSSMPGIAQNLEEAQARLKRDGDGT